MIKKYKTRACFYYRDKVFFYNYRYGSFNSYNILIRNMVFIKKYIQFSYNTHNIYNIKLFIL